eukprot:6431249-Amphidinium_carterae.1
MRSSTRTPSGWGRPAVRTLEHEYTLRLRETSLQSMMISGQSGSQATSEAADACLVSLFSSFLPGRCTHNVNQWVARFQHNYGGGGGAKLRQTMDVSKDVPIGSSSQC